MLALEPRRRDRPKVTLASVVIVRIPGGMRALNAGLTLLLLGTMYGEQADSGNQDSFLLSRDKV